MLLVLFGFIYGFFFWDGDILLVYVLVGLVSWCMVCEVYYVKLLFNIGVVFYFIGIVVLVLLGLIFGIVVNCLWVLDVVNLQYEQYWKLYGGMEVVSNWVDMLFDNLLVLGVQYGWQLVGMMLMGVVLMCSGWLKGQFSLCYYWCIGVLLVVVGMVVNLLVIFVQWYLVWDYCWCVFLLQVLCEFSVLLQVIGYVVLVWGYWLQFCCFCLVGVIVCVGCMVLINYLLQILICIILFYYFGLFMCFDCLQLLVFVFFIWVVNFFVLLFWLCCFCQGLVEWLWCQLILCVLGILLKDIFR